MQAKLENAEYSGQCFTNLMNQSFRLQTISNAGKKSSNKFKRHSLTTSC